MGLFNFRKPAKPVPPSELDPVVIELRIPKVNEPEMTPERLRTELFDAASSGDESRLCALCQAHEKSIFQQGMLWRKVPPEIKANPVLLKWYANGLKAIAYYCAEKLGKPELLEQLQSNMRIAKSKSPRTDLASGGAKHPPDKAK